MAANDARARPAVTLDLWHTLLYLEPDAEDRYMRRQAELVDDGLGASTGDSLRALTARDSYRTALREAVESAEGGVTIPLVAQLDRMAALAGRSPDPARYLASLDRLVRETPFKVAPGALETLERLAKLGVALGVVSNTIGEAGRSVRGVCDREGIGRWIQAWSFSDELPWTKPAPGIFLDCLDRLGSCPPAAIHVGDGASDIRGARNARYQAGVLYVGLANYGREYQALFARSDPGQLRPDKTISELADLVPIVQELLLPAR